MIKTTHPELTPDIHAYIKKWVKENSDRLIKTFLRRSRKNNFGGKRD